MMIVNDKWKYRVVRLIREANTKSNEEEILLIDVDCLGFISPPPFSASIA